MFDLFLSALEYILSSFWDVAHRVLAPAALAFVFLAFIPFALMIGFIGTLAKKSGLIAGA